MFTLKELKLWFKNKNYYKQYKAYKSMERDFKHKMKDLLKEFCPWSGWYMHEAIRLMLEFYHKVYESGNCVWGADEWRLPIVAQLNKALEYANKLEAIETADHEHLIAEAEKDKIAFRNYVKKFKEDSNSPDIELKSAFYSELAYEYLSKKYTQGMYKIIGENIWGWCD